jgi:hypothetical protein
MVDIWEHSKWSRRFVGEQQDYRSVTLLRSFLPLPMANNPVRGGSEAWLHQRKQVRYRMNFSSIGLTF